MAGKLATMMTIVIAAGMLVGLLVHALLLPWLLSSAIFVVNYALSLLFLAPMARLQAGAAAGVAVLSFLIRFGLIGLGLLLVALALPQYFLATAICFLAVYSAFLLLEIFVGLKGRADVKREAEA